jgi:hypothetical protein
VMEGWPGDVLSLLTLALHWEMRMTVMEGWPGDVLSLLSLYLLLSSALRSLSLSLYISVFLSLSSLLSPGFSSGSLCSLYVLGSVFPLLWPENGLSSRVRASRSWGTNASVSVRRNRGRKLAPLCTVSVLASCCVPGVTSSLEAEKRKRDGGLVG